MSFVKATISLEFIFVAYNTVLRFIHDIMLKYLKKPLTYKVAIFSLHSL